MGYTAFSCADVADNTAVGEVCRRKPSRQAVYGVGHVACRQGRSPNSVIHFCFLFGRSQV